MPLVSDNRLQALRQLREDNMLFRCDIEEIVLVDDGGGAGGKTETWQAVAGLTDLPCSVVALSGDETIAAQQIAPSSNAFIIVPWRYGGMIKAKHRVRVRGTIDTVAFEEVYGIIYITVPKTFSVQTTMYCRSGAAAGSEPVAEPMAAPMTVGSHMGSSRVVAQPPGPLGNTDQGPQPQPRSGVVGIPRF